MSSNIYTIAVLKAKAGKADALIEILERLAHSDEAPGCCSRARKKGYVAEDVAHYINRKRLLP